MVHPENIAKIRSYLLYNGQQELAGHFDTLVKDFKDLQREVGDDMDEETSNDTEDRTDDEKARVAREKSGFGSGKV